MSEIIVDTPEFSLELRDGIATMHYRKAFLNVALDLHTRGEFLKQLDRLERDPKVHGLVQLNDEQFSGEEELKAVMNQLVGQDRGRLSVLQRFKRSTLELMSRNLDFPKPVVSGVIGNMTLDEFGIALVCDRMLLSEDCLVRNLSLDVGLPAGAILTFFLPRVVGPKRAITLLTRADAFGGREAVELGLADRVIPAAELEDECRAEVLRLAQLPDPVVAATRKLIFSQFDKFEDHAERSINTTVQILQSRDW
ncbi:MAG: enoyl-CoA hydratase/isomerase family protein [Myxococcota bacterium]|nr:enoyl-CoA hydratase/isomerase family protein [Myxococcota bacterium]